jgi:hypothetical protein
MTGNTFAPAAVDRAVELLGIGAVDHLRSRIAREFPTLTPQGVDRVLALAYEEIIEQDRERNVRAAR